MQYYAPPFIDSNGQQIGQDLQVYRVSTNQFLQSSVLNNAVWTKTGGIVITSNTTIAPNGLVEADTLQANNGESIDQAIAIPNDAVRRTASVWITAGTSNDCAINLYNLNGTQQLAGIRINPLTGGVLQAYSFVNGVLLTTPPEFTVIPVTIAGVKWYYVTVSLTNNASGNTNSRFYILPSLQILNGTVIAWGTQFETGDPTPQIPTLAATVTRTAGVLPPWLLDTAGIIASINATPRQQIFTGNGNFTVPAGVTQVFITGAAGGGGGGGSAATGIGGGGGAGQSCLEQAVVVTPAQIIAVTIGTGGAGGAAGNNNGVAGTNTVFNSTAVVTLTGGNFGSGAGAGALGLGGGGGGLGAGAGATGIIANGAGGSGGGNQISAQNNGLGTGTGVIYGGGGSGGGSGGAGGGAGAIGILIVKW